MNVFVINGKTVKAKPFDFGTVCDLEDMGFSMDEMEKKPMKMIRAYVAVCMGTDIEVSGSEINSHIVSGGDLKEATKAMVKEMKESDFFQKMIAGKVKNQETTE